MLRELLIFSDVCLVLVRDLLATKSVNIFTKKKKEFVINFFITAVSNLENSHSILTVNFKSSTAILFSITCG